MRKDKVSTKASIKTDTSKVGPGEIKKSTTMLKICPYDMTEEWLFFQKKPRHREEPGRVRE